MVAKTPTWDHTLTRSLEFADGAKAVVEPCDLTDLLYGDVEDGIEASVPSELVDIAEKAEYEGVDASKLEPPDRILLSRLRRWLVADRTRQYLRPDGSEVTGLDRHNVRALIPYEHQIAIFRVALHMDLAQRVMLASFRGEPGSTPSNGNGKASGGSSE